MNELENLKLLAGIKPANSANLSPYKIENSGSNISLTGTEKAQIQREKKIEPGTDAWFRLWFSLPYLTGNNGLD